MNLLSMVATVERWLEEDNPTIAVDSAACLHSWNKAATCDRCVRACPVDALSLDDTIQMDEAACVQCGLCLHSCPVGAFSGADGTAELLNAVAQLPERHLVELACAAHPQAEQGPGQSSAVLRTKGCLAALGPAAYVSLFALGVSHLVLRLDACANCPLGQAQPEIERSLAAGCRMAAPESAAAERATLVRQIRPDWPQRRITAVTRPARSRRDFFKSFTAVGTPSPRVKQLTADDAPTADKPLPRERRRLLAAWELLPGDARPMPDTAVLESLSFAQLTANASCTACGVCERVCPTGALQLEVDETDRYQLTFNARNCVDCGLCLTLCEPNALQRHAPTADHLLADQPAILRQGQLTHCRRCNAGFASSNQTDLCPVCAFRAQNPFGSYMVSANSLHRQAQQKKRPD